jgi:hypothetical protein
MVVLQISSQHRLDGSPETLRDVGAAMEAHFGRAIGAPMAMISDCCVKVQLYEIIRVDVSAITAAIVVLAVAACVGGMVPAHRVASINPVDTRRVE